MGFYSPQSLIADARRHGVPILPVDIGLSQAATDLEWVGPEPASATTGTGAGGDGTDTAASAGPLGIRLGLDSVAHVGSLAERSGIGKQVLESLAPAGALAGFDLDRRQAVWLAGGVAGAHPGLLPGTASVDSAPSLPAMDAFDTTLAELFSTGITVDGYPTE